MPSLGLDEQLSEPWRRPEREVEIFRAGSRAAENRTANNALDAEFFVLSSLREQRFDLSSLSGRRFAAKRRFAVSSSSWIEPQCGL
jgi:hypothetical protein